MTNYLQGICLGKSVAPSHQYCMSKRTILLWINSEIVVVNQREHFPANRFPFHELISPPNYFWQADVEGRLKVRPLIQFDFLQDLIIQRGSSKFHEVANFLDFHEISDLLCKKLPLD